MNKTFGDLKTGDAIYYIAWDDKKKVYSVFVHKVFVYEPNMLNALGTGTITIQILPGEYRSHGVNGLILSKNDYIRKWSECTTFSTGLAITVDYDEAKKICLSFMRQYCELLREKSKNAISEMYNAIIKYHDIVSDFVKNNKY